MKMLAKYLFSGLLVSSLPLCASEAEINEAISRDDYEAACNAANWLSSEASMIPMDLLGVLFRALDLNKVSRLILVGDRFGFAPANPWLAVGWRNPGEVTLDAAE